MHINERLQKIREKLLDDAFIEGRGLGNEISFYIFDYDPKHELVVRDEIKSLKKLFRQERYNRRIIEFDLYKILLEIARKKRIFDRIFEMEKNQGNSYLYSALVDFAIPDIFINYINNHVDDHNVILITGVGKIYPFVRSHTILNQLQDKIEKIPVIMFYPGKYDGQSLMLFGKFKDDNYYRAFQLIDHK